MAMLHLRQFADDKAVVKIKSLL